MGGGGRKIRGVGSPEHVDAAGEYAEIRPPPDLLVRAKQYLGWERFPELAIQLVRIDRPVGYWIPPQEVHTILVFYLDSEVEHALFLLFHEVGHYLCAIDREAHRSADRSEEVLAWELGRRELLRFIAQAQLDGGLIERYDRFAEISLRSYGIPSSQYRFCAAHVGAARSGPQQSDGAPSDRAGATRQ